MASTTEFTIPNNILSDYLKSMFESENEAINTIAKLIEDLHKDKEITLSYVIRHSDVDRVFLQLFKFLQSPLPIIVGNVAFILGTLAEHEDGRSKILSLLSSDDNNGQTSLDFFVSLLGSPDAETVMNVAGTLGTLVEKADGRQLIISRVKSLQELLIKINKLLPSDYLWTSSNAALILARLSIDITGNSYIINSSQLDHMLNNLIQCLTFDEAGRGMNAAFALGRIFDNENTIQKYYCTLSKSPFVENLVNLVDSKDLAFMKNSCFCLSSVMECNLGHELVVANRSCGRLLLLLETLILSLDDEAVWFCVLTLKAISIRVKGCKLMKKNKSLLTNVNTCLQNPIISADVKRECTEILEFLSSLPKPPVPYLTLISPREVHISWNSQSPKNGFDLKYNLYYKHDNDDILAYRGKTCEVKLSNFEPNTRYELYLLLSNEIETSERSDICIITTDEDYPSEPLNLSAIVVTATQVKIGWDTPEFPNGVIKYYNVQLRSAKNLFTKIIKKYLPKVGIKDKGSIEQTMDRVSIVSGLQPETKYSISVVAINSCGKGIPAELDITTLSPGAHAPSKPNVTVLGKSEMHITWFVPESPMGRIFRYDVKLNRKKTIYSGTNTYCKISNLMPDTEYKYSVVAVTSLGKYESPVCKKRTIKDEYATPNRAPLYTSPSKMGDVIYPYKSRTMSLVPGPKVHDDGMPEINIATRRNSELSTQKHLNTRRTRLLPILSTSTSSFSSSTEISTMLHHPLTIINDVVLPLPISQKEDLQKSVSHAFDNTMFTSHHSFVIHQSKSK